MAGSKGKGLAIGAAAVLLVACGGKGHDAPIPTGVAADEATAATPVPPPGPSPAPATTPAPPAPPAPTPTPSAAPTKVTFESSFDERDLHVRELTLSFGDRVRAVAGVGVRAAGPEQSIQCYLRVRLQKDGDLWDSSMPNAQPVGNVAAALHANADFTITDAGTYAVVSSLSCTTPMLITPIQVEASGETLEVIKVL